MTEKIGKIFESEPAPIEIKRKIDIDWKKEWPNSRLKAEDKTIIKNEFNRLADNGVS